MEANTPSAARLDTAALEPEPSPKMALRPALWQQLATAAVALAQFETGCTATQALSKVTAQQQPAAQAMLFAVLRHWGLVLALSQTLLHKPPTSKAWMALLRLSLGLLQTPMYPDHTLVNQAVLACKNNKKTQGLAGLLNAVLRRYLRERDALLTTLQADAQVGLVAQYNYPLWWIQKVQHHYPKEWQQILGASATVAPQHLRVDTSQTSVLAYQNALLELSAQRLSSWQIGRSGLYVTPAQNVTQLPGFDVAQVSVQDAAAQLAAPALLHYVAASQGGKKLRVLDACAAPGGKTLHMLQYANERGLELEVTALDKDEARLARVRQNLARAGLEAQCRCICANALETSTWWDGQEFDAILLDAPCSASGIVRRHPDIAWLRRPSDIEQLALEQSELLQALWPLVKENGYLLYATCSIWPQEGSEQIQKFKQNMLNPRHEAYLIGEYQLLPNSDKSESTKGHNHENQAQPDSIVVRVLKPDTAFYTKNLFDHDGFYYALLRKVWPTAH